MNLQLKGLLRRGDATDNMLIVNLEFAQNWLDKEGLANNALLNVKMNKVMSHNLPRTLCNINLI